MKTCNNLDILKLDGCDEVTTVSVEKVINWCINLSYLDLSRYHFIDRSFIYRMAPHMPFYLIATSYTGFEPKANVAELKVDA